jgi:hypothetical protein
MEVIATAAETETLLAAHPGSPYLLFPEDRRFSIRMIEDLPHRWIAAGPQGAFRGRAARGEYYAFQIGVWAARRAIEDLEVTFSDLIQDVAKIEDGSPAQRTRIEASPLELPQHGRRSIGTARSSRKPFPSGGARSRPCGAASMSPRMPALAFSGAVTIAPKGLAGDDPGRRARGDRRGPRGPRGRRPVPYDAPALARLDPGPGRRRRAALHAARGRRLDGRAAWGVRCPSGRTACRPASGAISLPR